eukprot:3021972-Amphidinium_carterae.1
MQDGGWWAVHHYPILHIEATDLRQDAIIGAVVGQELRDESHRLERVHREVRATAIEVLVTHSERVDITAVLVAHAVVAFSCSIVSTRNSVTAVGALDVARVRSVGGCHA